MTNKVPSTHGNIVGGRSNHRTHVKIETLEHDVVLQLIKSLSNLSIDERMDNLFQVYVCFSSLHEDCLVKFALD